MAVSSGEDFILQVNTGTQAVPVWTTVGGLNRWSANHPKDRQEFPTFGSTLTKMGNRGYDYQASGYYDGADAGQNRLRLRAADDQVVGIRVFPNGGTTNGWSQDVVVGVTSHDADADPTSLQETSFEFTGVATPVIIGTGPLP